MKQAKPLFTVTYLTDITKYLVKSNSSARMNRSQFFCSRKHAYSIFRRQVSSIESFAKHSKIALKLSL